MSRWQGTRVILWSLVVVGVMLGLVPDRVSISLLAASSVPAIDDTYRGYQTGVGPWL